MRGQPGRGGRRMRAVNQALQAETEQQRHDAEDEDDDDEDGNALALVPIQYQGGDQNYDSQPFTMSGHSSSFCGTYSQTDFGGLSQYTPATSELHELRPRKQRPLVPVPLVKKKQRGSEKTGESSADGKELPRSPRTVGGRRHCRSPLPSVRRR
nr:hypothetical protein Iba_scaffold50930CG0010 [Ipomoea batatas]GME06508.1 hypothetical protein Iba_scaffold4346CG0090 [Ipomoea batatas]